MSKRQNIEIEDYDYTDRNGKQIKVGSKVVWYDPEKEARDLKRIWTVVEMNGDIILIHTSDMYESDAEVFADELKIVG